MDRKLYFAATTDGKKESITDINKLGMLNNITIGDEKEDATRERELGKEIGWIEISEEENAAAKQLIEENDEGGSRGRLAEIDIYIIRYRDEKELVDAGKLDSTYRTEEEYLELLDEKILIRNKLDEIKARQKNISDWRNQYSSY